MKFSALILLGIIGCSSIGTSRIQVTSDMESFEKALLHYTRGELAHSENYLMLILSKKPFDLRAHDLLSAVLKEIGKPFKTKFNTELKCSLLNPSEIVALIDCRNIQLRQAVQEIIQSRAELREANASIGAEMDLVTRFYPSGILAGLVQEITGGLWKRESLLAKAESRMLATLARYSIVREQVIKEALTAYLNLCEGNDLLPILESEIGLWKEHLKVISSLVDHGEKLAKDKIASELGLAKAEKDMMDARIKIESSTALINALLGQNVTSKLNMKNKKLKPHPPDNIEKALELVKSKAETKEALEKIQEAKAEKDVKTRDLVKVDLRSTYGTSPRDETNDLLEGFGFGARFRTPILILPLNDAITSKYQALVNKLELEATWLYLISSLKIIDAMEQIQKGYSLKKIAQLEVKKAIEEENMANTLVNGGKLSLQESIEIKLKVFSSKRGLIAQEYLIQKAILDVLLLTDTKPEYIFEE